MTGGFWESPAFWTTLIGVIVGSLLTTGKDLFLDRRNQSRLRTYAAIRIVCVFDVFIEHCLNVAQDEGDWEEPSHGQAERAFTVKTPDPPAFAQDIDWKSLDPALAYNILSFSPQIDDAARSIAFAFEMDCPPNYVDGFEERQFRFAQLGLAALALTDELRRRYGLPSRQHDAEEWSPAERLPQIKRKIEQKREAAQKRAEAKAAALSGEIRVTDAGKIAEATQ